MAFSGSTDWRSDQDNPVQDEHAGNEAANRASRGGAAVEFRGVTRRFGPVLAADNLSFNARPGEFLTLLGPSGSGKSTLLMLLAGFDTPTSGEVLINGRPMTGVPAHARNQGIVFQSYALFPHMTVAENLEFPLSVRGVLPSQRRPLVEKALERVRMQDFGSRYPNQLSGGQQQRVALARAIVFEPPVLLMDEPLSALDRNLREEMQLELKELHAKLNCTVLYVTHDQQEAVTMSDRVAVLRNGRIVQLAEPREIYEKPANVFVAGFIGETNFIDATVVSSASGIATLDIGEGAHLSVLQEDAARIGASMLLTVRPETIHISPPSGSPPSVSGTLQGQVERAIFLGETYRYVVSVGRRRLVVKSPSDPTRPAFNVGDAVSLTLSPGAMRLLPKEEHTVQ